MPVYEFTIMLDEEGRVLGISEGDHSPQSRRILKKFFERMNPLYSFDPKTGNVSKVLEPTELETDGLA